MSFMKQITIYILFLLCFFNLEAKTESLEDIKKNIVDLYDDITSLTNGEKYDVKYEPGEVFIYHAVWPYGKEARQDYPWPWCEGRIKAGKYRASKAAMDAAVRCLGKELAPKEIRINTVAPALIKTAIFDELKASNTGAEDTENVIARQYLGIGEPLDVANMIAFLLSNASRFITGSTVGIDGGRLSS